MYRKVCTLVLLCGLLSLPSATFAQASETRVLEGVAVTGLNERLGEPIQDFGPPVGLFHFATAAAHVPGAECPADLSASTPGDTLLATTADPAVLDVFGVDFDIIDPSLLNVPLRDVPSNVDPGGQVRQPLDDILGTHPLTPNQAHPSFPITVEYWLRAEGTALIRCREGLPAEVTLSMRRLIPNRLYTVWGAFATPEGPRPLPVGGAPNTFVTDDRGDARFSRLLNYCPFEDTVDGGRLLSIIAVLHSDHMVYAREPALPHAGLPPGVVAHAHLEFSVAGQPLP